MNEPEFITRERLEEIKENFLDRDEQLESFIFTLDKLFLAVDTASMILNNIVDLKRDEREIEREDWKRKGEDLKQVRETHDMRVSDMARILDTQIVHIIDAEAGIRDPTDYLRRAVESLMKV